MLSTMRGRNSISQSGGAAGAWVVGLLQLLWIVSSAQANGIHETTSQRRNLEVNSTAPSIRPSASPVSSPSARPSNRPSFASSSPTAAPSDAPSSKPSFASSNPSTSPSGRPSDQIPSNIPSNVLSNAPSDMPSSGPSYSSAIPSDLPSTIPSDMPSSGPSYSSAIPSDLPSTVPSDVPSSGPSYSSAIPSDRPSTIPSSQPSQIPSSTPSLSLVPSSIPSYAPSSYPSTIPSLSSMPSSEPSPSPSERPSTSLDPSASPSTRPSISSKPTISAQPTLSPSASPSGSPSSVPTLSLVPSSVPSSEPSGYPSSSPSDAPSRTPSSMPSETPSLMPSDFPSSSPSVAPSRMPSSPPSALPSSTPSLSPSLMPSSSPTLTCHDKADYRSPLNALTCEDHAGTRCIDWRVLNLNTEQLGDLINSCPETCEIPCGAFNQFSISISYHLSGIPGLLDPGPLAHLENFSRDFLQDDVKDGLDSVELISQSFVTAPTRRLRKLDAGQILKLSFTFTGFSIGLTTDQVTDLLVTGIDSVAFTSQLRGSGNAFFATALASSAAEADARFASGGVDGDGKQVPSTAAVVVSTLVSVSVFTIVIGALIYHNRSGKWVSQLSQLKLPNLGGARMDMASPRSNRVGSPLSFDDSAAQTTAGLLRLMASLSLSRSKGSTEDDSMSPSSAASHPSPKVIVSPMSEDSEAESVIEEHPLANIIPPMIVIDNIDDEVVGKTSKDWGFGKHIERQVVPSKRVEASSELLAALNNSRTHRTSNSFAGMMLYNNQALDEDISGWANADESRALSPLGIIMDSDDDDDDYGSDDDTSVASTPVRLTALRTPVQLRRSVSSSALESAGRRNARDALFSPTVLHLPSPAVSTPRCYADGPNDDGWSLPSDADDDEPSVSLTFGPLPSMVGPATPSNSRMVNTALPPLQVSSMQPCTPDNRSENESSRRSDRRSPSPIEGSVRVKQSLWSLSPITRAIKDNTARTLKRPWETDFGFTKKRSTAGEVSDHSEDGGQTTITGGHPSQTSLDKMNHSATFRCEFEAPRKGQLGLVIEANKITGPIVHAVKDYSPLFGLVKKGDKIVEVDGKKTIRSTLTEITRLLAVRPGRRGSNLRIVVERSKEQEDQYAALSPASNRHSRDSLSSHGSSSLGSSRFIEDVDGVGERHAFHSDTEQGEL